MARAGEPRASITTTPSCVTTKAALEMKFWLSGVPSADSPCTYQADVDTCVPRAVEAGATLIKAPYTTYYNWYQAVLLDPEGNVFRINFML